MCQPKFLKRLCQFVNCISLLILTSCTTAPYVDTPQAKIEKEIALDTKIEQTFVAHHAGLSAIDIYLTPQKSLSGAITFHLRQSNLSPTDLATVKLQAGLVTQPKFYRFQFKPIQESNGQLYDIGLEGAAVDVGVAVDDAYADGALVANHQVQTGDLAFRAIYDQAAIGLDLFLFAVQLVKYLALAFVLYILPGYILFGWLWRGPPITWLEQVGLGAGISVALYPVLALWAYLVGLPIGQLLAWLPGIASVVLWLWLHRSSLADWRKIKNWPQDWFSNRRDLGFNVTWLFCLVLLISTRFVPIHSMNVPSWGDSVHHTFIVQLILDHGGLFQSWEPYAPLRTFTYHFGFHVLMANWAWVSGMRAPEAVLFGGQILNLLAILAIYPLAMRLAGGNRWAGLTAVLIAGLFSQMPAFYVNWGRYTQLAAQIILPILLWTFDMWWTARPRVSRFLLGVIVCLAAGILLVHYRIAAIAATAGLAWPLWAFWLHRRNMREWWQRAGYMAVAALCVAAIVVPWAIIVRSGHLPALANTIAQEGANPELAGGDLVAWSSASAYYTKPLWVAAVLIALIGLWRRPQFVVPLGLWALLAFLATNPFLLHLPGSGLVNNFTLVIGAYIPIALLSGWLLGDMVRILEKTTSGSLLSLVTLSILLAYGAWQQLHIIDPFYQLVTPADRVAFDWINHNTPNQSRFLVNGFLAYHNSVVVGSDAGWWLPFYTHRENTVPPILYTIEQLQSTRPPGQFRQLARDLQTGEQNPTQFRAILCRAAITHVYIGQRGGKVGFGAAPLVPIARLQHNPDFQLLYQEGNAQVWAFDRTHCS